MEEGEGEEREGGGEASRRVEGSTEAVVAVLRVVGRVGAEQGHHCPCVWG